MWSSAKKGLVQPLKKGRTRVHYDYHENARFQEILRENKRKTEVRLNLRFRADVICFSDAEILERVGDVMVIRLKCEQ